MGGSRSGHADHDQRPVDLDGTDLGVALEQFGQRQPVAQQPDHPGAQCVSGQLAQTGIALDGIDVGLQSGRVPVIGGEVVDASLSHGLGQHRLEVENHRTGLGQHGVGQIVEIDLH